MIVVVKILASEIVGSGNIRIAVVVVIGGRYGERPTGIASPALLRYICKAFASVVVIETISAAVLRVEGQARNVFKRIAVKPDSGGYLPWKLTHKVKLISTS